MNFGGDRRGHTLRQLLAFIPHVASQRYATMASIARDMDIHPKTVQRIILALEDAGFPVERTEHSGNGGARIRIDREQARRFLLGLGI